MQDFEKLGAFYLGREFDVESNQLREDIVLYDSRDLVTHAVCVGMTGSGKTGLCIGLLEEAAIDGIPSIIIDPKGDLPNLMLTFPQLRGEDFLPWINEEDARNKGMSPSDFAAKQADKWKQGLSEWGQSGARIQKLKDAAEFAIYTPGSTAGIPVSILKSFAAPARAVLDEPELLRERISTTVTSLLTLLGIHENPIQSREHILISTLIDVAWKQGQDLELATLIQQIQTPPITRIGVFDLEAFYPSKDRFQLAMMLNNLLAAPGFEVWMKGAALDPASLLYTSSGKPRVCIFSMAHLSDSERMFFVTLLLTQVLGWIRTQPGTSSLRALLYMDEIFGYFPPVANPPSKEPLMTLLKQGRAFGLGVVLATQNPVDLDYKGLANAGTWFIGRLQTEQDKARLLDGLQGAGGGVSLRFDRAKIESTLSNLQSRVFLMNNVHEDAPVVFQTRWTLSYLAGPVTRAQIQKLQAPQTAPSSQEASRPQTTPVAETPSPSTGSVRPVLPPGITQFFLPMRGYPENVTVSYSPYLLAIGATYYADAKAGVAGEQTTARLLKLTKDQMTSDWQQAEDAGISESDLDRFPAEEAVYEDLPSAASIAKNYERWNKMFSDWIFRSQALSLLRSAALSQLSQPGESERDFRIRIQQMGREQRDRAMEQLKKKFAPKLAAMEERIRKAQQSVERESNQARDAKMQTAISFGTTVLGALFGRKKLSATNLGRATTAARGVGRSMRESEDIERAQQTVGALQQQYADLQADMQKELDSLSSSMDPQTETLMPVELKPKKTNISVKLLALVWAPSWIDASGKSTPAWR